MPLDRVHATWMDAQPPFLLVSGNFQYGCCTHAAATQLEHIFGRVGSGPVLSTRYVSTLFRRKVGWTVVKVVVELP